MILTSFGGDSADETRQRVFAVACVVAGENVWKALESAWVARTGGIPFHPTGCGNDNEHDANKPRAENQDLNEDLTTLLAESGAWGFGVAVDLASHREFFPLVAEELSHHFCFIRALIYLARFAYRQEAEQIKFCFDSRIKTNFNAAYLYSLLFRDRTVPHIGLMSDEISFLSSKESPRVQIGDLYARECMKHLDNIVGPISRPERLSMTALRNTKRFGGDFYLREYFEDKYHKFDELRRKVGFNRLSYTHWLNQHGLVENATNSFRFLSSLDYQEEAKWVSVTGEKDHDK